MTIKIALDAGHDLNTAGKRCLKSLDSNETREWWLNDRIIDRVEKLLEGYDCDIIRVDDTTGMKNVSLSARVNLANKAKADVYISMHHNAGINGGLGGGTVVFYCSSKSERKLQAQKLYNAIVGKTKLVGNRASKVVNKNFYVIRNTTMPAFLIENGFMDSKTDVPIILTKEHAEKTAQAVAEFLIDEFGIAKGNKTVLHTVKKGETLLKIADRFGVTYQEIAKFNGIANPNYIRIGQILKIPKHS